LKTASVITRIVQLTTPPGIVQRVKLGDSFNGMIDNESPVQKAVDRLRELLLKLVAEGAKIVLE
jgi:hypothetical protein